MKLSNLQRAAEINESLKALNRARATLSEDKSFSINDIVLPHDMAYRVLQVINLEINSLHKEIEDL